MKNMRKLASLLVVLALVLSLATTAFAGEGPFTITLNNAIAGHTYTAFQIFKGDLDLSSGVKVLSNIQWGDDVSQEAQNAMHTKYVVDTAAALAELLTDETKVKTFANDIAPYMLTGGTHSGTVTDDGECTIGGLEAGYYLIRNNEVPAIDGAFTAYIMKVVSDTSANVKTGLPTVDKTVENLDYNIGDTVKFTLTGTIPAEISYYTSYQYKFVDTLSAGLTYKEITSVKVVVDGKEYNVSATPIDPDNPAYYNVDVETDAQTKVQTVKINFPDLKSIIVSQESENDSFMTVIENAQSVKVVVEYEAILNENAVIGSEGNPNTVYLEYSNNPNGTGTGITTEKKVEVYTWEIPVFKYTGTDTPLAGAGFTLYDSENNPVKLTKVGENNVYKVDPDGTVTQIVTDETGRFVIEGLDSGTYILKETQTPAGYNTATDTTVTIGADGALNPTEENTTGESEIEILNSTGTELPETGGIGTTIFYVCGGILVLAAVVLLVTKRRMSAAE